MFSSKHSSVSKFTPLKEELSITGSDDGNGNDQHQDQQYHQTNHHHHQHHLAIIDDNVGNLNSSSSSFMIGKNLNINNNNNNDVDNNTTGKQQQQHPSLINHSTMMMMISPPSTSTLSTTISLPSSSSLSLASSPSISSSSAAVAAANYCKSSANTIKNNSIKALIINVSNLDRQSKEPLTEKNNEKINGENDDNNENGADNSNKRGSGLKFKVLLGAFVAFFTNSFSSGYNIGVLNTPEQILKAFFNNSLNGNKIDPIDSNEIEFLWSIAVSILVVGALFTSIITGYFANLLGRRGVIFLNVTIGMMAMFLSWGSKYMANVPLFMAGRLVAGFHTGIASSIVPMYLMEISPKSSASSLGTIHVMGLNGGIFVAQALGLESIFGTPSKWQLLFFANAVFIFIGLLGLFFMPESPVYLFVVKKQEEKAVRVLQQIRKRQFEVNDDLVNMRREIKREEGNGSNSFWSLLKQSEFRRSLLIVCCLHAGQQLVGINAVFYYSTNTFRSVGLSQIYSQYGTIGCSLLNTLCAVLASRLLKSFTPRTMILVSTIGTTCALFILPISMSFNHIFEWLNYVTILTIFVYVFMFAIGQGPIPFMIGGQIFDSSSMSIGMSCGCFINWFCNFLVAFAFPLLVIHINQYVFFIFFAFDLLLLIFILLMMPKPEKQPVHRLESF